VLHSVIANQNAAKSYGIAFGYGTTDPIEVEFINSVYVNTYGAIYVAEQAQLTIRNSIFYGSTNGELLAWGDQGVSMDEGNAGLKALGAGDGNIVADPLFDADFHLQSGSPGINAGLELSTLYPETDAAGKPRVTGGAPDIGAFEDY